MADPTFPVSFDKPGRLLAESEDTKDEMESTSQEDAGHHSAFKRLIRASWVVQGAHKETNGTLAVKTNKHSKDKLSLQRVRQFFSFGASAVLSAPYGSRRRLCLISPLCSVCRTLTLLANFSYLHFRNCQLHVINASISFNSIIKSSSLSGVAAEHPSAQARSGPASTAHGQQ